MKHPNALYRARMKPRCSLAALRAARIALAMPLLAAICNNAYARSFSEPYTPAKSWREWCDTFLPGVQAPSLRVVRSFGFQAGAKE